MFYSKSTTVKSESSPEPDTTESEASSKNETCISLFLASKKSKKLFIKTLKRACVVCKNIENTIKCSGPCQSYFHEECFDKSHERYHKSEPKNKIKKPHSRRKRRYSKVSHKKKEASSVPKIMKNDNENIDKVHEQDDFIEQSSDHANVENKLQDEPKPDHSSKSINCIYTDNENTSGLSELESVNKDSIPDINTCSGDEKNVNNLIGSQNISITNDKTTNGDLKYMCSLCKANKLNCFSCGLEIDDLGQKIICKICKLNNSVSDIHFNFL